MDYLQSGSLLFLPVPRQMTRRKRTKRSPPRATSLEVLRTGYTSTPANSADASQRAQSPDAGGFGLIVPRPAAPNTPASWFRQAASHGTGLVVRRGETKPSQPATTILRLIDNDWKVTAINRHQF